MNFLVLVACIVIIVFISEKIHQDSWVKGRSKLRASATSGVISFLAFIFLSCIRAHLRPQPSPSTVERKSRQSAASSSLVALYSVNHVVDVDLERRYSWNQKYYAKLDGVTHRMLQ